LFHLTKLHKKGFRVSKLGWSLNNDQLVLFPFREIGRLEYTQSSGRKAQQKKKPQPKKKQKKSNE
jgi:hypothetical protein